MEKQPIFKFHFESGKPEADEACSFCQIHYGQYDLEQANVHVVLGGDGSVLSALHRQIEKGINLPIFGLNYGDKGKMCNEPSLTGLNERVQRAERQTIFPLKLTYTLSKNGQRNQAYAFNEFTFFRDSPQSAHLLILLKNKNFKCRIPLNGDGFLVSTALGSTGYYANVPGEKKVVPEKSLGLRSINTDSHLDLLLPDETVVAINKMQGIKRPMKVEWDGQKSVSNISRAVLVSAFDKKKTILFDRINSKIR